MINFQVGDRVRVLLDSKSWAAEGWFTGTVVRIDPYSKYRSFYWVQLDEDVESASGGRTNLVSVLNPKNIVRN